MKTLLPQTPREPVGDIERETYIPREVREDLDPRIIELAEKIARVHGPTSIRRESNGVHIYFPSPLVVEEQGIKEVLRPYPHGCLNAEKYLGTGKFAKTRGTKNMDRLCCRCNKYHQSLSVRELLLMPPIEERVGCDVSRRVQDESVTDDHALETDEMGVRVPRGPGKTTPLTELPDDHVAIQYLRDRGFTDLPRLVRQFNASYCYEELPQSRALRIGYRRLPNGFTDTPEGRIILEARVNGSRVGWQARVLNRVNEMGHQEYWCSKRGQWIPMEVRNTKGKWELLAQHAETPGQTFGISKYKTATGTRRNEILMGLDAAVAWNREQGRDMDPLCYLVEGPLSAARPGPPGVAMMGSELSESQARLILNHFRTCVYIPENNEKGRKSVKRVQERLGGAVRLLITDLPESVDDPGELSEEAWRLFKRESVDPRVNQRGMLI